MNNKVALCKYIEIDSPFSNGRVGDYVNDYAVSSVYNYIGPTRSRVLPKHCIRRCIVDGNHVISRFRLCPVVPLDVVAISAVEIDSISPPFDEGGSY